MTAPVRIQRLRTKGFNLQAVSRAINGLPCIYVGRPTRWGNPFVIGDYVKRGGPDPNEVGILSMVWCRTSREYADARYTLIKTPADAVEWYRWLRSLSYPEDLSPLRGHNLACFCPLTFPDGSPHPCHADVLLDLAREVNAATAAARREMR